MYAITCIKMLYFVLLFKFVTELLLCLQGIKSFSNVFVKLFSTTCYTYSYKNPKVY